MLARYDARKNCCQFFVRIKMFFVFSIYCLWNKIVVSAETSGMWFTFVPLSTNRRYQDEDQSFYEVNFTTRVEKVLRGAIRTMEKIIVIFSHKTWRNYTWRILTSRNVLSTCNLNYFSHKIFPLSREKCILLTLSCDSRQFEIHEIQLPSLSYSFKRSSQFT